MGCGASKQQPADQLSPVTPVSAPPASAQSTSEADLDAAAALIQQAASSVTTASTTAVTATTTAATTAALATAADAERYDAIIEGHEALIEALFKKLDKDSNGFLVAGELKEVVGSFTGVDFDEDEFFGWFDIHGGNGKPDRQLDLKEFGW